MKFGKVILSALFGESIKILREVHRSKHNYITKMSTWKPARIAE